MPSAESPQSSTAPPAGEPPAWLITDLAKHNWNPATVVEDLRDFAFFAMPEGDAFDPWAADEERLRKLPAWLAGQTEAIEAWLAWREELAQVLTGGGLTRADLRRWLVGNDRQPAGRLPQEHRGKVLTMLKQAEQLETIGAWLAVHPVTQGAS